MSAKSRKARRSRLQYQAAIAYRLAGCMFIGPGQWDPTPEQLWLLDVLAATAEGRKLRLRRKGKRQRAAA